MWDSLLLALAIGLPISFLPGFSLCYAWGASRWTSIVAAVPVSCGLYSAVGAILYRLGHPGTIPVITAAALVTIVCLVFYLATRRFSRRDKQRDSTADAISPTMVLLYIGVVAVVTTYAFLSNIGTADSVNQASDNPFHLTRIVDMAHHGNYSMLDTSFYNGIVPEEQAPTTAAAFYPEGFHIIAALILFLANVPAGIAENASTILFICIVYPLGMSVLMQSQFGKRSPIAIAGSLCACACVMFPIRPLVVNGVFPFAAGIACLPAMLFLFVRSFDLRGNALPRLQPANLASFAFALLGLACLHPSAAIASGVAVVPFIVGKLIPPLAKQLPGSASRIPALAWQCASLIAFAVLWVIVYQLPFLEGITSYSWGWSVGITNVIERLLTMGLRLGAPAYALGLLVIIGLSRALASKDASWLGGLFLIMAIIFMGSASSSSFLSHLLSGFWYTDPERTSAMVAIAAVPLSALGLATICEGFSSLIARLEGQGDSPSRCRLAVSAVAFFVFAQVFYSPTIPTPEGSVLSGYGQTEEQIRSFYSKDNALPYSQREQDFVKEAVALLPEDAVVANNPFDGSVLSDPLDGLNTMYRSYFTIGGEDEARDSILIRKSLDRLSADEEVASAVERSGVQYVLQLSDEGYGDYPGNDELRISPFGPTYAPADWTGIDSITDDTPGFEVVLADGDMRLYKIIGTDETSASTE